MDIMPIDTIPDWEQRLARQDAFWDCEIIDRPVVVMSVHRPNPDFPAPPQKQWASLRERWMDSGHIAACALSSVMNTEYLGDALPCVPPNLGPEVFSAFFGTEMEYGETTSWSIPNLADWADVDALQFSEDNVYWRKLHEITDALLQVGRGKFYTGLTDLHPGGDAVTAFRDPLNLNIDMIEHRDEVKALLARVGKAYFHVYDTFEAKLRAARQAISCWAGIVTSRTYYVPSNDFSCMISKDMFDDVFLPGIAEECRHMEANVYHLDGPGALQHLESLLAIPELNCIQWVYGAGNGRASDWMYVYKRCQAAGKALQLYLDLDELDFFMANLKPEGLWIGLGGIENRDHAEQILAKVAKWK